MTITHDKSHDDASNWQPKSSICTTTSLLALSIFVHTIEESFQVPSYQQGMNEIVTITAAAGGGGASSTISKINTVSEVLLDSVPIFVILPFAAYLSSTSSSRKKWIHDTLMTVSVLHPIFDHVLLTFKFKYTTNYDRILRRPGTVTALLLVFPLGIYCLLQKKISILPRQGKHNNNKKNDYNYNFPFPSSTPTLSLSGVGLGLLISILLYVVADIEIQNMLQ